MPIRNWSFGCSLVLVAQIFSLGSLPFEPFEPFGPFEPFDCPGFGQGRRLRRRSGPRIVRG